MTMRYYKLENTSTGEVLASYARNQPNIEGLLYLTEAPNDTSLWDGSAWVDNIPLLKELKLQEIIEAFESDLQYGYFNSTALNIDVDCRRAPTQNDKQNVEGLISYMTRNSITDVTYKGYEDQTKAGVTISDLEALVDEMEDHVFLLYNKKWTKEAEVIGATSTGDIEAITW